MIYLIINMYKQQNGYNIEARNELLEIINFKIIDNNLNLVIGDFVEVESIKNKYKIIDKVNKPTNFLDYYHKGKKDYKTLIKELTKYYKKINDDDYKFIIDELVFNNEQFFYYPAAKSLHHAFIGGLAIHTIDMLEIADVFIEKYNLNQDLMYTAIILHDVGKLEELEDYGVKYSLKGSLLGHINIIYEKVSIIANELKINNELKIVILKHLLLSHHGKYEYGSPKEPMIKEALVLNFIDDIDAKLNYLDKNLEQVDKYTFTPMLLGMDRKKFLKI